MATAAPPIQPVADFPDKLEFLFHPARYKVAYGGRGGAKSWGFARALLLLGVKDRMRILCARETMNSITDSVHKLLGDQVEALGIQGHYQVLKSTILGRNGTEIIFAGLRQNINNLKSYESVDICWVEEAQTVSKNSWDVLIPTIRKETSEIWISFNPDLPTDETYQRFVTSRPTGAVVVNIGWRDNPWFPEVLRREMADCRARSEADYNWIWEGLPRQTVEGAVYEKEFADIDKAGRITRVPYDKTKPVQTWWDIGDRYTSIWFTQSFPFEHRFTDYLHGEAWALADYLSALQGSDRIDGRKRGYVYSMHWLPHDATSPQLGTGKSIEEQMRQSGFAVSIVPRLTLAAGINAVRTIWPQCWFDGERCADGLQGLRHYRYAPDGQLGQQKREPLHDINSHPADAIRYAAVGIKFPPSPKPKSDKPRQYISAWS